MSTHTTGKRFIFWAALSGLVGGAAFLAIAELAALIFASTASPILAVGSFVIDIVPRPLKEFAITTFGEYDKIALLAGLGIAVVVASAIAGILEYVRPPLGVIALFVAGILSGAAIVTRAEATPSRSSRRFWAPWPPPPSCSSWVAGFAPGAMRESQARRARASTVVASS